VGDPLLHRDKAQGVKLTRRAALVGSLATAASAKAQQIGSPGETLDEITARGSIIIGVYDDFAPYSYKENGEAKGTDIEAGRLIAEALGVKPEIKFRLADENVDADLRDHVWRGPVTEQGDVVNVMLHMPIDRELALRNDMVVMGSAYASEKTVLAWSKTDLGDIPTMTDFTEYDIAVENHSIADAFLRTMAGGAIAKHLIHRPTMAAAVELLLAGEASGVMGPMAQIEFELAKAGGQHKNIMIGTTTPAGLGQGTWAYGVAVRTNYHDLFYAVEEALANAVKDGRVKAIYEKYGLTYNPPPPPKEE
jgi:ABC-type amino acid transport substrate-binding protein